MRRFCLELNRFQLEYDRDYGVAKRSGWSVAWHGSYAVQLDPWLLSALWRAWRSIRSLEATP